MLLYCLYAMWLRIWVLTFIHVPDDGSAEPKHVAYWCNLRVNDVLSKKKYIYIYIYTVVQLTVYIITELVLILSVCNTKYKEACVYFVCL
jgi:hypothetical protein